MKSARSHELAAKLRRARRRRAELGPVEPGHHGLLPSMRCSKANVTWLDLVNVPELRDLVKHHKRELLHRRTPGRVPPTAVMALAFYSLFSGLKGLGGAFVQLPIRALMRVLGSGESTVQSAHALLERWGYLESFEQSVDVEWVDELGHRHLEAEVWAKRRITREGFDELRREGELTRRIVMAGPQRGRVLLVAGFMRRLAQACSAIFRLLARRFAGRGEIETPSSFGGKDREEPSTERPHGGRAHFSDDATGPPAATGAPGGAFPVHDVGPTGLAVAGSREVADLVARHAVTAALAYPDAWRLAPDARARLVLLEQFEQLHASEVRRRVFAAAGPGELAELQRQVAAEAAAAGELAAAARAEAKTKAKARWNAKLDAVERLAKNAERNMREQRRQRGRRE